MRKIYLLFMVAFGATNTWAQQKHAKANAALLSVNSQYFIENKGQWHPDVLYLARMGGLDAWITKYGVNYTFYKLEKDPNAPKSDERMPKDKFNHEELENSIMLGHRVLFELEGHNPNPQREGKQKQEGYYNYLIGNDPSKHAGNVGLYKEAIVKNVYDGIDIRYYFDRGLLRYDYVIHPEADPSQIQFKLKGSDKTYLKNNSQVVFTTRFGEVAMAELTTYQQDKSIASRFVRNGDTWSIAVSNYDKSKPLIIDPLVYSTYIGGSSDDYGQSIVVDGSGNAYITGYTQSSNYDTTAGAYQTINGGNYDVFVTKLNATGTALLYSTYLGGSSDDRGFSIAIDGSGNAYITGYTQSTDYDITTGALQTINGGNRDVFITKLNTTGTTLLYSTYIGGSSDDYAYSIAIEGSGNAYITGYTNSTDFDITTGAFQTTNGGNNDVFVTKLNATGTSLLYSTYIGGSSDDYAYSIAIDGSGNAYITGYTQSTNYDITTGVFQNNNGGSSDVFVTKLNSTGTGLVYSTYLGGGGYDYGRSIAIDGSGNAYITGYTQSIDYDISPGAFQTTYEGGILEVFVTKLNATGTALLYSTYLGGSGDDRGYSITIDGSGNAYITGKTQSSNYDVTSGAFQTTIGGDDDVFVTKLNATGTSLLYSTYLGGSYGEYGNSIAIDGSGNMYITGYTGSSDYDITPGAFKTTYEGSSDVFVTKLDVSGSTNIEDVLQVNPYFSVYPNPNIGTFTIHTEKGGAFELYNTVGQRIKVYELPKAGEFTVQEPLPKGLYFLKEVNTQSSFKIVVQ